jgi:NadR type nicotinamide-nucleotide adenylyltransferase
VSAPRAVVLTGPESTGKTELAAALARWYGAPLSDEYAREYAEARGGALGAEDVEAIARGQRALEDRARAAAAARGRPLVVHDTDLVSTVVYARHYYGECPAWVVDAARARRSALYLLCAPDLPWEPDAVRDTPEARERLFAEFRRTLEAFGCRVASVAGDRPAREAAARPAVDALLRETRTGGYP